MEKKIFRCRNCKKLRGMVTQVKEQKYCSEIACQQARKNEWNRKKYASDEDYRATQKQSTQTWLESVGGCATYHRQYRKRRKLNQKKSRSATHKQVRSADKSLFAFEDSKRANKDACPEVLPIKSGRYLLFPVGGANKDALLVNIAAISTNYD